MATKSLRTTRPITRGSMPDFVEPQLATLAPQTPSGSQWVHEVKFDGYRAQVRVERGKFTISTRRGYDWSDRFSEIAKAAAKLPDCIMDGEAVVLDELGRGDFSAMQSALASGRTRPIILFAFDLLYREGRDLRRAALLDRKEQLSKLFNKHEKSFGNYIRYSEHFTAAGSDMHATACAMGLEGVVSKRVNATYRSGRNEAWIKSKCGERETLLIGGWRETAGGIQSVAMGEFRNGGFEYVGKARTGFQDHQENLRPRLLAAESPKMPFTKGGRKKRMDSVGASLCWRQRSGSLPGRLPDTSGTRNSSGCGRTWRLRPLPRLLLSARRPRLKRQKAGISSACWKAPKFLPTIPYAPTGSAREPRH